MKRVLFAGLVGVLAILGAFLLGRADAAVPPRPEQPRPDIFTYPGIPNMQTLNPVTVKAKNVHAVSYRLITMPGCVAGTIPSDMVRLETEMRDKVQFNLIRNDAAYDFTVRINCGSEQIRICGSINVFCLNRGFPYVADVEISDVLSNWQLSTRLSILLHEIAGHAIGTWNEQYALCGSSCGFLPSPNWSDFMNTGALSRHFFEVIELERWDRTLYPIPLVQPPLPAISCQLPAAVCARYGTAGWGEVDPRYGNQWNGVVARWIFPNGNSIDPGNGYWYDALGRLEWGARDPSWGGVWNFQLGRWVGPGSYFFDPSTGLWSSTP